MAHDRTRARIRPRGYPKLAGFMVEHDYVMIRQFRQLAVQDLLYLQAEICELEHDLAKQGMIDANASDERRYYDREWWYLHQGESRGTGGEQWKLALRVRAKLREYYSAVQQYQSMISSQRPSQQQRKELQNYINSDSMGGLCQFLGKDLAELESSTSVYDPSHLHDLLFLREDSMENDCLSRMIAGPILEGLHRLFRLVKVRKSVRSQLIRWR
ncbi:hypothetical protein PG999_001349 [Apiospora kogelbergensis]|uniref:DUF6594 domain-containing protein n=1 Tax=Apiospora kogelbergensis TaxID=1337665 RepID=A0AAW0REJ1_9PEZI